MDVGVLRLDASLKFEVPWTVIFGPSGSGKSSLLRAMAGMLKTRSMSFARHTAGGSWKEMSGIEVHRREIGYAPQRVSIFPHLSVRENVAFAASSRRLKAPKIIAEALKMFRLSQISDRQVGGLSGGERQRVNLARAFAVPEMQLMLLDEPFTGIDRSLRDELLPNMREIMSQRRVQVISVTHDVEEALMLEANVLRLVEGKVVATGPAAEVLNVERRRMLQVLEVRTDERR